MTTQTAVADIRNVDLFDKLCDEEIEQLLTIFEEVEFSTNELIFEQGAEDVALYVIVSGNIEITIDIPNIPDESEAVVELLNAGQVFGESTFFHTSPHSATARCVTDVRVLRLTRDRFDAMIENYSLLGFVLAKNCAAILAARLQATDQWVADLLHEIEDAKIAKSWHRFRRALM